MLTLNMLTRSPYLSLILPCYNEDEHIIKSADKIIHTLKRLPYKFEIIFIDDKSCDQTSSKLKKIKGKYKNLPISIYLHSTNLGRGRSVSEGIYHAKGNIVGYMDIDCEVSPKYINKFVLSIIQGWDVAVAKRKYKFRLASLHRHLASLLYSLLTKILLKLPISDTEAGFKFFNTLKIKKILYLIKDDRWFWDTEVIARSISNGLFVSEIPVIFERRLDKTSTVKIFSDSIKYMINLINLRLEML